MKREKQVFDLTPRQDDRFDELMDRFEYLLDQMELFLAKTEGEA